MSKHIKPPFTADFNGGYVRNGDGFMFAQVRGWGQLQYEPDAEKTQDSHLQYMVDALNEKWERENRCKARWRAGVLVRPGETPIPNGTRCSLPPHDDTVPHEFKVPK